MPRLDQTHPLPGPRMDANFSPNGIPAGHVFQGSNHQPVSPLRCDVAEQAGGTADLSYQQIECAVAVHIADRKPAGDSSPATESGVVGGHVAEFAAPIVDEQLIPLGISLPVGVSLLEGSPDPTIYHCQVKGAIVVEVGERRSKTGTAPLTAGQSRHGGAFFKLPAWALHPEAMIFVGHVRHEQVAEPLTIDVPIRHSHIALGPKAGVTGHAAYDGLLLERAVFLVDPQVVGLGVIGHENVGPAIAVEIGTEDAEAGSWRPCQPGGDRAVFKSEPFPGGVATPVAVKTRDRSGENARIAVGPLPCRIEAGMMRVVVKIIDHDEVQPAIAVVIEQRNGGAPEGVIDPCFFRYILEPAIALVEKKQIAAIARPGKRPAGHRYLRPRQPPPCRIPPRQGRNRR